MNYNTLFYFFKIIFSTNATDFPVNIASERTVSRLKQRFFIFKYEINKNIVSRNYLNKVLFYLSNIFFIYMNLFLDNIANRKNL